MKKYLLPPLFILFYIFFSVSSNAQDQQLDVDFQQLDVIKLRTNVFFEGKIIEYRHDTLVVLQTVDGRLFHFHPKIISKISQKLVDEDGRRVKRQRVIRPYAFEEKGVYLQLSAGFNAAETAGPWIDEVVHGKDFTVSAGYKFNRYLGVGLGVGAHYYYSQGKGVYPVFAEARGYLTARKVAPYYAVAAGYGFAVKDEDKGIQEANGGLLFHPALGLRIGGSDNVNFIFDVGVKFQRVNYQTIDWGVWRPTDSVVRFADNDVFYKRLTIRAGIVF